ncbi:type 1 pili tip component [Marinimicrobium sp. ARAG 43.8]|uniref:type 1 pili tip component n=1 Tax=Marinimicrobium sp. ARAG 43.8 TaxID=3418719 RepID=UPI003CF6A0FD
MKVSELLSHWEKHASGELTHTTYSVHLPIEDAARIKALSDMYPKKTPESLITDLLSAALAELESGMPYIKGQDIVAEDEQGDPLYKDDGPTPRFLSLSQKHLRALKTQR